MGKSAEPRCFKEIDVGGLLVHMLGQGMDDWGDP